MVKRIGLVVFSCSSIFFLGVASLVLLVLTFSPSTVHAGPYTWNAVITGAKIVHNASSRNRGAGTSVAVIDGLVDCTHWQFLQPGSASSCRRFGLAGATYSGYSAHGTHVASTIGARGGANLGGRPGFTGIAPNTKILAYGYLGRRNATSTTQDTAVAHAYARGARVMNMSYGPKSKASLFHPWQLSRKMHFIPKYKKMVFVQASGNDGYYLNNQTYVRTSVAATGNPSVDLNNLIIVGAVNSAKKDWYWSNAPGERCFLLPGQTTCQEKNKFKYFFMVAPGQNIYAAVPGPGGWRCRWSGPWRSCSVSTRRSSGTSMAAPHVSGAVALLQGRWPVLKSRGAATTNILFKTAQDLGAPGVDGIYGWGFLRIDRAFSPLGTRYLSDGSKRYPWGGGNVGNPSPSTPSPSTPPPSSDRMLVSNALNQISSHGRYVSFFDAYDRDFPIVIDTSRTPIHSMVLRELASSAPGTTNRLPLAKIDKTVWSFQSTLPYSGSLELQDMHWRFRYSGKANTISAQFGDSTVLFYQPKALSFLSSSNDATVAGVNPVLKLASNGLQFSNQYRINKNFSVAAGFAANSEELRLSENKSASKALMFSTSYSSDNLRNLTNLTATRLSEHDGLLGSRLTGAFGQAGGTDTIALTLSNDWNIRQDYVLSSSYTVARSDTGGRYDRILSLSKDITSDAMAVGIMKRNIFRRSDKLYASISQPLRISSGTAKLSHDDYYDENGRLHRRAVDINLAPSSRELAFQLAYTRSLSASGTLKAVLFTTVNKGHVAGNVDGGALIRFESSF